MAKRLQPHDLHPVPCMRCCPVLPYAMGMAVHIDHLTVCNALGQAQSGEGAVGPKAHAGLSETGHHVCVLVDDTGVGDLAAYHADNLVVVGEPWQGQISLCDAW